MNPHAEMLSALLLKMVVEMLLDPLPFINGFILYLLLCIKCKKIILYLGERKYHQDKYESRVTLHHGKATLLKSCKN